MTTGFLKISCRDCGNETIIFERATTQISCTICSATLTSPAGGKAELVGCTVIERMD